MRGHNGPCHAGVNSFTGHAASFARDELSRPERAAAIEACVAYALAVTTLMRPISSPLLRGKAKPEKKNNQSG